MRQLKFYIMLGYFLLLLTSGSSAQIQTITKEPYKQVQFFTPENQFYDDGSVVSRFAAYKINSVDSLHILNVPESIATPHTIQIIPGRYIIEVQTNGDVEKFLVEIDESSFQQFRLQPDTE
jgi:hypothetical protein